MRKYRNISRTLVLVGMVLLVYYNLYEKKAGQIGSEDEIAESVVLSTYALVLKEENKPMLFRGYIEGGLFSLRIYTLSLTDPLAFLTTTFTALTFETTLFISIMIPLLLLLLFGRFFCAWICPYSMLAEAGKGITRMLHKMGIDYFSLDFPKRTGPFFLVISLILGALLSLPITTLLYPPRILTEGIYHLVISGMITSGLIFIILLWLGEILVSPHLFCRRLCPGGALFSILGRVRVWRVKRSVSECDACGVCNPACPYDLKPMTGYFPGECDNCGLCIDACRGNNRDALSYVLSSGRNRS